MTRRRVHVGWVGVMLLSGMLWGGCEKEIPIWQYPTFWEPGEIESIAVVPFRNTSIQDPEAGNTIADRLAVALAANGTYPKVYNRRDLQALLTEEDLKLLAGGQGDSAAILKRATGVRAIITGTVSQFDASTHSQQRQEPQYTWDQYGNAHFAGNRIYTFTRNDAIVTATATMLSTKTGQTIHATYPAQSHMWAQGSPPEMSMDVCLAAAVNVVTSKLLAEFAIVGRIIKVKPHEVFRITTGELYDGKWEDKKNFTTADEKMTVVIKMPPEADRSQFRITVIRANTKKDLFELVFRWSRDAPVTGQVYIFNPSEIAAAGGGPGQYVLKFYAGVEPIMENRFYIHRAR